jgi:probable rRNA maturation factor
LSRLEIECPPELRPAVEAALREGGVSEGHVSVDVVASEQIRDLNRRFRGRDEATDVLAFPIDEAGSSPGPRELGDVVVCPEHAHDVEEAVVHGVLHLAGHDHERDRGAMLEHQKRALAELRGTTGPSSGEGGATP